MDVIDIVKKDHDRVEELFTRFRGGGGLTGLVKRVTGNVSARERRTAVEGACRELDVHARLEEEILYPAARATGDADLSRLIDESLREHARMKEMVHELQTTSYEGEQLDERVNALEDCVTHHVNEEEGEMLPRLEQVMPAEHRAELGRRFQAGKRWSAPRARKRTRRARATREGGRRQTTRATKGTRQKKRARGRRRTAQRN